MQILYSDARIVVCLKPAGALSTDEPGGVPALVRQALGLGADGCVRTVHRLDRPVGGVMVLARSRMAASLLSRQVQTHAFRKEYLAVLEGALPQEAGTLRDELARDAEKRITYAAPAPTKDTRTAVLHYRVLGEAEGLSLVHIRLETGRTHQIRAQFSSRGYPLAGDTKYGAKTDGPIALWSYRVAFTHPQTGEAMTFSHEPPQSAPWTLFPQEYP